MNYKAVFAPLGVSHNIKNYSRNNRPQGKNYIRSTINQNEIETFDKLASVIPQIKSALDFITNHISPQVKLLMVKRDNNDIKKKREKDKNKKNKNQHTEEEDNEDNIDVENYDNNENILSKAIETLQKFEENEEEEEEDNNNDDDDDDSSESDDSSDSDDELDSVNIDRSKYKDKGTDISDEMRSVFWPIIQSFIGGVVKQIYCQGFVVCNIVKKRTNAISSRLMNTPVVLDISEYVAHVVSETPGDVELEIELTKYNIQQGQSDKGIKYCRGFIYNKEMYGPTISGKLRSHMTALYNNTNILKAICDNYIVADAMCTYRPGFLNYNRENAKNVMKDTVNYPSRIEQNVSLHNEIDSAAVEASMCDISSVDEIQKAVIESTMSRMKDITGSLNPSMSIPEAKANAIRNLYFSSMVNVPRLFEVSFGPTPVRNTEIIEFSNELQRQVYQIFSIPLDATNYKAKNETRTNTSHILVRKTNDALAPVIGFIQSILDQYCIPFLNDLKKVYRDSILKCSDSIKKKALTRIMKKFDFRLIISTTPIVDFPLLKEIGGYEFITKMPSLLSFILSSAGLDSVMDVDEAAKYICTLYQSGAISGDRNDKTRSNTSSSSSSSSSSKSNSNKSDDDDDEGVDDDSKKNNKRKYSDSSDEGDGKESMNSKNRKQKTTSKKRKVSQPQEEEEQQQQQQKQ